MASGAEQLKCLIRQSKSTVFFGGAGVSTESGIPDFRSPAGLYAAKRIYGHTPEELLSHSVFVREPELFFRYYKKNLIAEEAKPNAAHIALASLERQGLLSTVITQNIDGLHRAAGSKNVLELHGSNWRQYCVQCGASYSLHYILDETHCKEGVVPVCEKCGGIVRPDVVLYGERLQDAVIHAAAKAIACTQLLIVGGTSLRVYPAAGLLGCFEGRHLVLINQSETPADARAQLIIRDAIGKVLANAV
ncbi:MAG: NAD-dependent protein deacylase [Oscillospiraceae bacterium]|nr:NAD-dependent protein deacylase [Oscillospiraceae bacterium]